MPLPAPRVDTWILSATGSAEASAAGAGVLDEGESRRLAAISRKASRTRYLAAHVGLRTLLGSYLGQRPDEVRLVRRPCPACGEPHGRPAIADEPSLHFSMSHSGDVVLYAVAPSAVGIDVEASPKRRRRFDFTEYLHPAEQDALRALPETSRGQALLSCWVRKEAFLKGTGAGLAEGVGTQYVGLGAGFAPSATPTPHGWLFFEVAVEPGYAAAVALHSPSSPPHDRALNPRRLRLAGHSDAPR